MPRLLLLLPTTTYRAEAFLEASRKLKLDVTVGSEQADPVTGNHPPDLLALEFHDPDKAAHAVVEFARTYPIHAVIGVDDHTTVLASVLAGALGLPHNTVQSVSAARNKYHMRERLRAHAVPVPRFSLFSIDDDPQTLIAPSPSPLPGREKAKVRGGIGFPCVVKPLILSASCGVIRADDRAAFVAAFRRVAALLMRLGLAETDEAARHILVEEFVPGREVALEGLLTNGELRVLALFDKPDPLDGPFFEETLYVTPSRLPAGTQADIASCAARAASALGLREGPIHGELRVNSDGIWVIEVAARTIGGRCSRTLRFTAGMSLEELILRHALRMDLPPLDGRQEPAGVMMLPIPRAGILKAVHGEAEAMRIPGIQELAITAQPGQELVPLPEGTRYLGFLIARGDTAEAVESALREAHRKLEFVITPTPAEPGRSRAMSF